MRPFIISSDTTADLPADLVEKYDVDIHPLFFRFGESEVYGSSERTLAPKDFYARMRSGEMPTTMASNPEDSKAFFEKRVSEGYDVIHIAFSSALSSSCQNASIAASEVMEEHPEARIVVIDSLAASMGEGLVVYKALMYQQAGHSFDEVVAYTEDVKKYISHQFTVNDLFHLHRGGRVSKTTALIGTIINIKPLLHVNDLGQLISIGKARGRKKSLIELVNKMVSTMGEHENETIMLSHGDCEEDALFVAELIKERTNVKNIIMNYICPTIGAHSGPGTVALFFEADHR